MKNLFIALLTALAATIPVYSQTYQTLNPSSVYLVDYDSARSVMLFRGNIPFTNTNPQTVDFTGLETAFKKQFNIQTGNSFPSSYSFVDITLINADEGLNLEATSFQPTNPPPTSNPSQPLLSNWAYDTSTGSIAGTGMQAASLYWWPVNPGTVINNPAPYVDPNDVQVTNIINFAGSLQNLMESAANNTVFYIHCTSGHDRTGMALAAYLYQQYFNKWVLIRTKQCKLSNPQGIPVRDLIDSVYIFATTVPGTISGVAPVQFDPPPLNDLYKSSTTITTKARIYPGASGPSYRATIEAITGPVDPDPTSPFPTPPVSYFTTAPTCTNSGKIGMQLDVWNFVPPPPLPNPQE